MFADLILVLEVMISGVRTCFLIGELESVRAD